MARDELESAPASENWADKRIFTTGEAAIVCKVSQQTIIRCFDAGRLTGFKVPGSKFRRIPRDELIRFMKANGIPTEALEGGGKKRILLVDDDPRIIEVYEDILKHDGRFDYRTASTGYDAGLLTESYRPHLIVLDYMLPDINGNIVCQRLRENPAYAAIKVLVISGVINQDEIKSLIGAGAAAFIKKPFHINEFLGKITELLGMEAATDIPRS